MAELVDLGKSPESPEERCSLIGGKLAAEDELSAAALPFIQKTVMQFLIQSKGYGGSDFAVDRAYSVILADGTVFQAVADLMVSLEGRSLILIKCASNSLESWERYCVAFCRTADAKMIPLAVITDSESMRIVDAATGQFISEDPAVIPSRDEAVRLVEGEGRVALSEQAMERERRILYAFDAIRCPAAKEGDSPGLSAAGGP